MSKFLKKKLALILMVLLIMPIFWNQASIQVSAATTPSLTKTKVDLAGIGKTYDLNVKNKVAKSKYQWSSLNNLVATVAANGVVTAVGKGTTTIRCKITFPTKKTKTLSCSVTVSIPASEISITNAVLKDGAYQLTLGSSYDFDTALTPAESTDTSYWYVDGGDKDCIRIDDAKAGKVTALKTGTVALKVKAVKNSTKEEAGKSIVQAAVIIEVLAPTATVKTADITNSNQITVVFDSAIQQDTVIGTDSKLTDNIVITQLTNAKNVLAKDPGILTPSLSTDMKTLTITSANMLEGDYKISISKGIKTLDGVSLGDYIKKISYTDVVPPYTTGVTLDDTGVKPSINFNEPIDFTNFKVSEAQVSTNSSNAASSITISILNNTHNYIVSADKKSLTIDLSGIAATDYNKSFSVIISGIKDLSGNVPATAYLIATLYTDKTLKPQAQLLSIDRTSYNILTATFDRSIQFGGVMTIDNGSTLTGMPDPANTKKVNYIMSENDVKLSGSRTVTLKDWTSYNVVPTDLTGRSPVSKVVFFDVDKIPPVLSKYEFDKPSGVLTLTYNEEVNLSNVTGAITARLVTPSQDIQDSNNIIYSNVTHNDGKKIIKLKITNMSETGYYTFTLNPGFVTDNFRNPSTSAAVTINGSNGSSELPGPISVTQSDKDPSQITLQFANKLDLATAQNVSNYSITGVTLVSAELKNNSISGATVILKVLDGSIDFSVERQLKISGVMGYSGTYSAITSYTKSIVLKDNKKAALLGNPEFDRNTRSTVKLTFSEAVQGSLIVNVTQLTNTTNSVQINNSVSINGNVVNINLTTIPSNGTWLRIDIISNNLTDLSGNPVVITNTSMGTGVTY